MRRAVTLSPIKRIDSVEISRPSNRLIIKTEKEEHKISMGTHGKAEEVRNAYRDYRRMQHALRLNGGFDPALFESRTTLPLISILAFGGAWLKDHDLKRVSCLARETLILVPLGLPFFLPLAFAERFGLGFWTAMTIGFLLASTTIGVWFVCGPK